MGTAMEYSTEKRSVLFCDYCLQEAVAW